MDWSHAPGTRALRRRPFDGRRGDQPMLHSGVDVSEMGPVRRTRPSKNGLATPR
jgi:hypothetical protein